MANYERMAREIYSPLAQRYKLQFAALNNEEFFLIGHGFALWIFVDPRDRRADTWYVSMDENGSVLTYTLMYINESRFTAEDRAQYGKPSTFDEVIAADMRVLHSGLINRCQDILAGDKSWLQGYPDAGDDFHHVTKFLSPFFKEQGFHVIIR